MEVALKHRQVVYSVHRSFYNASATADELSVVIDLPTAAVATRLRVRMAGRWYRAALMEKTKAAAEYKRLTGSGPLRRRGPALLSWSEQGKLDLSVFPAPPRTVITVEYELVAPLCYSDGYLIADYPVPAAKGASRRRPVIHVRGGISLNEKALLKRLGRSDVSDVCQGVGAASPANDVRYLAFKRPRRRAVSARLGSYRVGPSHHIVSYDLDIARTLMPWPSRAHVVFVVDASHSVGLATIRSQLALIRGYVHHLPDARYEVVLYRRFARRLFGTFSTARQTRARLAAVRDSDIKPGNGSNLERGVGAAVDLLRGKPGPQRIIVFTDSRFRSAFAPHMVETASAGTRALIHYVDLKLGRGALTMERDDEHVLAAAASLSGGIVSMVSGDVARTRHVRGAMLDLIRPDTVDDLTVAGVQASGLDKPHSVGRGRGFRGLYISRRPVRVLRLHGKIWGRVIHMSVAADERMSRSLPRLVFGNDAHASLPAKRVEAVARAGGVVSPRTSLLVSDRLLRPTSVGARRITGIWGRSFSSRCGGVRGLRGYGVRGHTKGRLDKPTYAAILRDRLRGRNAGCDLLHSRRKGQRVRVTVETTGREIVDVIVRGGGKQLRRCMRDAAWQLRLGSVFDERRGRYAVDYDTVFGRGR